MLTNQQQELAGSLVTLNAEKIGSSFRSPGCYWAACGIIADNFGRHDPNFDRAAFMAACGF